jgi:hypothetical protein
MNLDAIFQKDLLTTWLTEQTSQKGKAKKMWLLEKRAQQHKADLVRINKSAKAQERALEQDIFNLGVQTYCNALLNKLKLPNNYRLRYNDSSLLAAAVPELCRNKIGYFYIQKLIKNTKIKKIYFEDILTKNIVGILFCEYKGDNIVELHLLCADKKSGVGPILMGTFLIALKHGPLKDKNIQITLNVAYGFRNLSAICLYDKFGFQEADEAEEDLDMTLTLNNITEDEIMSILMTNRGRNNEPLCSILIPEEHKEKYIQMREDVRFDENGIRRSVADAKDQFNANIYIWSLHNAYTFQQQHWV